MINIENITQIIKFKCDEQSHIILNKEACKTCEDHACVQSCPANCYAYNAETNRLDVAYESCLECGTCFLICDKKAVDWSYPRGGYGVQYRLT